MLGWILVGLAAAAVGVVIISGMVTKKRIQEKLKERGIEMAIITEINKCTLSVICQYFRRVRLAVIKPE